MKKNKNRRSFLKSLALGSAGAVVSPSALLAGEDAKNETEQAEKSAGRVTDAGNRKFNSAYRDEYLSRVAFPIGGMGAGMFCLEGSGAISHMSIANRPEIFHEPAMFAAIAVKDVKNGSKVLEGPVPGWKFFGQPGTGNGAAGTTYGLPRFREAEFETKFPFGIIRLKDNDLPITVKITGWSPFIPTNQDNSCLPVGALEYQIVNRGTKQFSAVFSYNSSNFLSRNEEAVNRISGMENGFILTQDGTKEKPYLQRNFAIFTDDSKSVVDYCWFRGGWWDPMTMAWNHVREGLVTARPAVDKNAPGASIFIPFSLMPGESKNIRLMMAWFVPESDLHVGEAAYNEKKDCDPKTGCCASPEDLGYAEKVRFTAPLYKPWYCSRFENISQVAGYWRENYKTLLDKTRLFSQAFYTSSLPAEVMEAVAANLTILKSPTVLRQPDGRLWSWEGCGDDQGCCHGSCTHVWNYAQALPHLFPALERSLRATEFCENQNHEGHQGFRANMPISPVKHDFYAAADGQLGGIMKVYRDWRISGDSEWLGHLYPMVKRSMDFCINTWDPRGKGVVEEPHHNTYDIEFWGPDGMCTSFYLGALRAISAMGQHLGMDVGRYDDLYAKGKTFLETRLYNGEYFIQEIEYKGLKAPDPATAKSYGGDYSQEAIEMLQKEGPKYQYGNGCLSDGVLGAWIGRVCGLGDFIDPAKVKSHLTAVYKYNLKIDLSEHANPQRPAYALGKEGGLLLCTWPKGGKLSLPFVYSDEVWTGIEYQVASHLIMAGKLNEGLEIVRLCRSRYDGRLRNPFNEYECGHWYARAMASYGLIQALTGMIYDAVEKTLYIDSKIGDFACFLSVATGFGVIRLRSGIPSLQTYYGSIEVSRVMITGKQWKGKL